MLLHDGIKLKARVSIIAICGIVAIEAIALSNGIDGVALSASAAAIGAIGGWWAKSVQESKRPRSK